MGHMEQQPFKPPAISVQGRSRNNSQIYTAGKIQRDHYPSNVFLCYTEYVSVAGQELDCDGRKIESFVLSISELDAVCSCQNAGSNRDELCTGKAGRMLGTDKTFKSKLHLTVLSTVML